MPLPRCPSTPFRACSTFPGKPLGLAARPISARSSFLGPRCPKGIPQGWANTPEGVREGHPRDELRKSGALSRVPGGAPPSARLAGGGPGRGTAWWGALCWSTLHPRGAPVLPQSLPPPRGAQVPELEQSLPGPCPSGPLMSTPAVCVRNTPFPDEKAEEASAPG